jgi:hypothetical protein
LKGRNTNKKIHIRAKKTSYDEIPSIIERPKYGSAGHIQRYGDST